jgi:hypothetical protein
LSVCKANVLPRGTESRTETRASSILRRATIGVIAEFISVAEPPNRLSARLVLTHPKGAQFVGAHVEVQAHFVFYVADDPFPGGWKSKEAASAARQFREVVRHQAGSITLLTAAT